MKTITQTSQTKTSTRGKKKKEKKEEEEKAHTPTKLYKVNDKEPHFTKTQLQLMKQSCHPRLSQTYGIRGDSTKAKLVI